MIYATSAYQKDLAYLPQVPAFHFRETNDIEWFVSRGYVYVHHDIRGSGKSVDGEWQFFSERGAARLLRRHRVGRRAALVRTATWA